MKKAFVVSLFLVCSLFCVLGFADTTMKMNYTNEEVTKIIDAYSKAAKQKFIVDPGVRGKISIYNPAPVSLEEAFNQISKGLALNGFAVVKEGDTYVVLTARNAQRGLLEVTKEVPNLKPERLVTWIVTLKNVDATKVLREVRILSSNVGEIQAVEANKQLIITDWASNLQRVAQLIKEIDVVQEPAKK